MQQRQMMLLFYSVKIKKHLNIKNWSDYTLRDSTADARCKDFVCEMLSANLACGNTGKIIRDSKAEDSLYRSWG